MTTMTKHGQHLTEEQLVAHYYADDAARERAAAEQHIAGCAECAGRLAGLRAFLCAVEAPEAPERAESYGADVWGRLRAHLPEKPEKESRGWFGIGAQRWALGGALATVIVAAFFLGRWIQPKPQPPTAANAAAAREQVRERILLVALSDHMDRSQMVLVELANASATGGKVDISAEQSRAEDLVDASRLYRQTAAREGDLATANVLDELERTLLDIAHGPSQLDDAALKQIQQRIEAQGLIFKVRVIGSKVKSEQRSQSRSGMKDESNQQSRPRKQT